MRTSLPARPQSSSTLPAHYSNSVSEAVDPHLGGQATDQSRLVSPASWLRQSYRTVRSFPDRMLHRRRHSNVRRRLISLGRPQSIVVVCLGNVCRSPYLCAVLQRLLPDVSVSSAGFIGPNRSVPLLSLEVSRRRGIDLSHFRSKLLTSQMARGADLIIVMDVSQAKRIVREFGINPARIAVAGDLDPSRAPTRTVTDPWMQAPDVFESTFARLDRCAETVASALTPSSATR